MKKILNYLKPFWFVVLIVIALTFMQVRCTLALPDYMSDIVTNGIQNGGITENELKIVRASELEHILAFIDEDQRNDVYDDYTLIEADEDVRIGKQLYRFDEDLYVLNEEHDEDLEELLLKPIVYTKILSAADLSEAEYQKIAEDQQTREKVVSAISDKMAEFDADLNTVAIAYIGDEYRAIGLDVGKMQTNYIFATGLEMLGVALVGVLMQIGTTYLATKVAAKVEMNIRSDVFKKVTSFSAAEFSKIPTSSLITRTTNDINQIRMLVQMMLRVILIAPLTGIVSAMKVFRYPDMLWILLVALAAIIGLMLITLFVVMPRFKTIQATVDRLNSVMREFLNGMLVVRAFNTQDQEEKRFDDANAYLSKTNLFVERMMALMMPMMMFIMNAVAIAIVWFAGSLIDINAMSVGDMMAFIQYSTQVLMSFMMIAVIWIMVPRALVSARRVFEVIDMPNSIVDQEETISLPDSPATLKFDDVCFKYPNAEECVLEHINFEAKPGETVAFIGSTGSGKSTLIKLIPRLFDVTSGKITYGGVDIKETSQKELREHIGYVPQKAVLFTGDIESNIAFGQDLDQSAIEDAIDISQSRNIVESKSDGIKSLITQGGTNVSGGQKQRLSIARAIAKNPDLYIFDDSFSALDYQTDKVLRQALKDKIAKTQAIILIVAQRIATIKDADRIVVLDQGRVVGEGTHEELLKNCDVYQEIAHSQLSEEELANA